MIRNRSYFLPIANGVQFYRDAYWHQMDECFFKREIRQVTRKKTNHKRLNKIFFLVYSTSIMDRCKQFCIDDFKEERRKLDMSIRTLNEDAKKSVKK
jgi:hypothetical protein